MRGAVGASIFCFTLHSGQRPVLNCAVRAGRPAAARGLVDQQSAQRPRRSPEQQPPGH
jgi:hypothetical protein